MHRSSVQNQTELKLKVVEEALASRRQDVARRAEKSAAQDVQDLAQSVEKAADEVLGDDAQALRQARAAVDKIARELSEKAGLAMSGRQKAADPDQGTAEDRVPAHGSNDGKSGSESNQPDGGNNPKAAKAADAGEKTDANGSAGSQKARAARSEDPSGGDAGPGKGNIPGEDTEGKGSAEGAGNKTAGAGKPLSPDSPEASADGRAGAKKGESGKPAREGTQAGNGSARGPEAVTPTQQAKSDPATGGGKGGDEAKGDSGNTVKSGKEGEGGAKPGANGPGADGPAGGPAGGGNKRVTQGALMEHGGGNANQAGGGYAGGGGGVPVQDLGDWLNRLDRVEALLERPQLRAGVARVQQAAEQLRGDMKRNASKPSPEQIQQTLLAPLTELRDAISSELARREGRENDAPIDRDPVPRKYEASVRRYYEALGGGK